MAIHYNDSSPGTIIDRVVTNISTSEKHAVTELHTQQFHQSYYFMSSHAAYLMKVSKSCSEEEETQFG